MPLKVIILSITINTIYCRCYGLFLSIFTTIIKPEFWLRVLSNLFGDCGHVKSTTTRFCALERIRLACQMRCVQYVSLFCFCLDFFTIYHGPSYLGLVQWVNLWYACATDRSSYTLVQHTRRHLRTSLCRLLVQLGINPDVSPHW